MLQGVFRTSQLLVIGILQVTVAVLPFIGSQWVCEIFLVLPSLCCSAWCDFYGKTYTGSDSFIISLIQTPGINTTNVCYII